MIRFNLNSRTAALTVTAACICCLTMAGCSAGGSGTTQTVTAPQTVSEVSGVAHGGQQPISGATVQLWAAATNGDAGSSTPLLTKTVTTDANGMFVLTGLYTCPTPTSLVYVTVTGGNPGLTAGTNNQAIQLMTAIGQCNSLNSNTFIAVDEVTTVAMVAALGEQSPALIYSYSNVGSQTADSSTFSAAFALATEYANSTTGTAPGTFVPTGMTVPVAQINTLANILSTCVNSAGGVAGDGSSCGNLFSYATTLSNWVPANTVRALLDIWFAPSRNLVPLFGLSSANAPFQPTLSAPPPLWSVALTTTNPPLSVSPTSVSFSGTAIGQSAGAQTVTLQNTSGASVNITGVELPGPNPGDFPLGNSCGTSLAANGSCTFSVGFTPTGTGMRYADLEIDSSGGTPLYVPLSGTAVAGSSPTPQGSLTFEQTSLSIPSPTATSNNGFIHIKNSTNADITLLPPFTLTGTNAADFSVVNTAGNTLAEPCGTTLAAGASCRVIVSFSPTIAINTTETATLNFTSGAGAGTVTQIPLTGMVTAGWDITQIGGCSLANQSGCLAAIQTAVNNAVTFYHGCSGGTGTGGNYTVVIPAGTFDLSAQTPTGANGQIDMDGLIACNGTFVLAGAGASLTTIYMNNNAEPFHSSSISNVTIEGMSLRRNDQTGLNGFSETAGTYVSRTTQSNGPDTITVNILPGYPSVSAVLAAYSNTSNWIRAYDNSNILDPVTDPEQANPQESFDETTVSCMGTVGPTQCTFTLLNKQSITPAPYTNPTNIVCFKMESQGAYFLSDAGKTAGTNVGFTDVYWYDAGRGAFLNINNAFVTYSALKRRAPLPGSNGQAPCFASWAGGPQFNQPTQPVVDGVLLDHFLSEGSADQMSEIFQEDPNEAAGGSVLSNITVHSGFGGGPITFNNACGMTFDWTSGTHGVPLSQTMSNCDWFDGNPAQLKNPLVNGNPAYNGCVSYYPNTVGCPTTSSLFPNANQ